MCYLCAATDEGRQLMAAAKADPAAMPAFRAFHHATIMRGLADAARHGAAIVHLDYRDGSAETRIVNLGAPPDD